MMTKSQAFFSAPRVVEVELYIGYTLNNAPGLFAGIRIFVYRKKLRRRHAAYSVSDSFVVSDRFGGKQ